MTRDREPDWTLLGRYLDGDCSPAETETVGRWVVAASENAQLLDELRRVWADASVPRPDVDAGWQAMQDKMAAAVIAPALMPHVPARPAAPAVEADRALASTRTRWWFRPALAAAVVGVAAGATFWRAHRPAASPVAPIGAEYATGRGQRAEVTLTDGTRIWLNVDSRVRLLPGYGGAARDVALEGEAYFVVQHDASRPFRVHARRAVSEDLGTEFGVRAYADDDGVAVTVASGRVVLRGDSTAAGPATGVELVRGQMGRLTHTGRVSVTDGVDLASAFGWREGRLTFVDRPLAELLRELGRWYDVDIVLEDTSRARTPVTFVLGAHTADQALNVVARVVDLRYHREGRVVRLSPKTARR